MDANSVFVSRARQQNVLAKLLLDLICENTLLLVRNGFKPGKGIYAWAGQSGNGGVRHVCSDGTKRTASGMVQDTASPGLFSRTTFSEVPNSC